MLNLIRVDSDISKAWWKFYDIQYKENFSLSVFSVYNFFGYFEPNLGMASVCFLYWTQLQCAPPPLDENLKGKAQTWKRFYTYVYGLKRKCQELWSVCLPPAVSLSWVVCCNLNLILCWIINLVWHEHNYGLISTEPPVVLYNILMSGSELLDRIVEQVFNRVFSSWLQEKKFKHDSMNV
jgi:hypothetical protein